MGLGIGEGEGSGRGGSPLWLVVWFLLLWFIGESDQMYFILTAQDMIRGGCIDDIYIILKTN